MSLFSTYLHNALHAKKLTLRDFAAMTGTGISTISQSADGSRPGPRSPKILAAWADALELHGNDRARFFLLADLSRSPPNVQEIVDVDRVMENQESYDANEPVTGNYFGDYLAELILGEQNKPIHEFASDSQIDKQRLMGLINGHIKPSTDDVDRILWVLNLDEIAAAHFKQLAAIAHAPVEARADFKQVLDMLTDNARQAAKVRKALDEDDGQRPSRR